jgi:hypothetical protein
MSRYSIWIACLGMAVALTVTAPKASARTDVSINLRIGDPYRGPRVIFEDEPDVVIVPGTRVYYVRDHDYDLYRYGSYWYYNYDGGWYRSRRYNGPFTYVGYRAVPRPVAYVPVRYRRHWREVRDERYYRRYNDDGRHEGRDRRGKGRGERGEHGQRGQHGHDDGDN